MKLFWLLVIFSFFSSTLEETNEIDSNDFDLIENFQKILSGSQQAYQNNSAHLSIWSLLKNRFSLIQLASNSNSLNSLLAKLKIDKLKKSKSNFSHPAKNATKVLKQSFLVKQNNEFENSNQSNDSDANIQNSEPTPLPTPSEDGDTGRNSELAKLMKVYDFILHYKEKLKKKIRSQQRLFSFLFQLFFV